MKIMEKRNIALWVFVLCTVSVTSAWSQEEEDFRIQLELARESIKQWAETETLLSQERKDWKLGKSMLEGRIELLKNEIKQRKESIEKAKEMITDADKQREEFVSKNEELKEASQQVTGEIAKLEAMVKTKLLPMMPTPLSDKLRPLVQKVPQKPDETKLSLSVRFGNVIGILNEVNKFNRNSHTFNEVRELQEGQRAEVRTLYLGIGQAYYVSNDGQFAGVGWPDGASGWKWQVANESAADIAKAINVLEGRETAAFVSIPAEIH
ncbi:MAG: DUF3450 family protein [Verrucomicrobiota bacterium]